MQTHIRLLVAVLVMAFTPILTLAQEVSKPASPQDLRKFTPDEVVKLEKMDSRALAYHLKGMWRSKGYAFAVVARVQRFDIEYFESGKVGVAAMGNGDPIIILIPASLPFPMEKKFVPYIKLGADGRVATYNPATGIEQYYDW